MVSFDGKFDGKDEVYMMAVLVILLSATSLCLSVEDGWGGWRRLAWLVAETFRLALCLARQAPSRTRTPSYPNIDNYKYRQLQSRGTLGHCFSILRPL